MKVVTSIAIFYDLDDPIGLTRQVKAVLEPDGLLHFERSHMPSMLRMTSCDTICHEHVEFCSSFVMERIHEAAGLKLVDVEMNAVNGGSFAITAAKASSAAKMNRPAMDWLLDQEQRIELDTPRPHWDFASSTSN